MNQIQVTVRGNVATEPRHLRFDDGNTLTSFRLASNQRSFDRERNEWVDRGTTYLTVNCRRALAANVAKSVRKGHPVMVTGRLRERFWTSNDRSGQTLLVDADTIGHDLHYGTAEFVRIARVEQVHVAGSDDDDQIPTDVTGLTVLGAGVTGAHEAELLESGDPAGRRDRASGDLDDDQDESDDFTRVPDPALA
jgi:single-strand DNA-binding protein